VICIDEHESTNSNLQMNKLLLAFAINEK